jgi:hypothetical protein
MNQCAVTRHCAVLAGEAEFIGIAEHRQYPLVRKVLVPMNPGEEVRRVGSVPCKTMVEQVVGFFGATGGHDADIPAHGGTLDIQLSMEFDCERRVKGAAPEPNGVVHGELPDSLEAGGIGNLTCQEAREEKEESSPHEEACEV